MQNMGTHTVWGYMRNWKSDEGGEDGTWAISGGSKEAQDLPRRQSGKESACQCRRWGFNPWVMKIPWRRKWQPTPIFLPGECHGQSSRQGYSPWGYKRVRLDWAMSMAAFTVNHKPNLGFNFRRPTETSKPFLDPETIHRISD